MRRALLAFAAWAALAGPSLAAPTIAAIGNYTHASGLTTGSLVTTADVAAGDTIVLVAGANGNTSLNTISDCAGNTYSQGNIVLSVARLRVFWVLGAKAVASGCTVNFTFSSTTNSKAIGMYVAKGAPVFDQDGLGASGSSASPAFTGSTIGLTGVQQALVIGAYTASGGGSDTVTESSGFSTLDDLNVSGGVKLHVAYKVTSSTTAPAYAPTNSASRQWVANVDVFKTPSPCINGLLMGAGC